MIVTPAGNRTDLEREYLRVGRKSTSVPVQYGHQIALDRSVTIGQLIQSSNLFAREWIEQALSRQLVRAPEPFDYAYLDFEPEDDFMWRSTSSFTASKQEINMLLYMLKVAKKKYPAAKWGYYSIPFLPRATIRTPLDNDRIKRFEPLVQFADYSIVNRYITRNHSRLTYAQHGREVASGIKLLRDMGAPEVFVMAWHGWTRNVGDYYKMLYDIAGSMDAGFWVWADCQGPWQLAFETAAFKNFASLTHSPGYVTRSFKERVASITQPILRRSPQLVGP